MVPQSETLSRKSQQPPNPGKARIVVRPGRHFLQIPGPTNIPSAVLRALGRDIIDHRSAEFSSLASGVLEKLRRVVGTSSPIIIYPSSGTGAWEGALVNVLSPGDRVLMPETGFFSEQWTNLASRLGFDPVSIKGDWRTGASADAVERALDADTGTIIKAVAVVHNETSTGVRSHIDRVREAIDRAGHPALLLVDTVSSLGSIEYHHDGWGVDVMIGCSQKGLQLPPGIGINVLSDRALVASEASTTRKGYWDWGAILEFNADGFYPYTPPTNMFFALDASLDLLLGEGMDSVLTRHHRHASAVRAAVEAWGLEIQPTITDEQSNSLTAVRMFEGFDADELRKVVLDEFDTSLGTGLGRLRGRVFRIGHLGSLNDAMVIGAVGAVEAGLGRLGVPLEGSGLVAATERLAADR